MVAKKSYSIFTDINLLQIMNIQEVAKNRWAIQKGNAQQVIQEVDGIDKQFNRYTFDLSTPMLMPVMGNEEQQEVCIGLLAYFCPFTFTVHLGFILENGKVNPRRIPNLTFLSHPASLFADIKQHVNVDRIETERFYV